MTGARTARTGRTGRVVETAVRQADRSSGMHARSSDIRATRGQAGADLRSRRRTVIDSEVTMPRRPAQGALTGLERAVRARLDGGDERGAVGLVVERFGPSVRGYLRTLLLEDEAEEAFSIFAENLLTGLPGFRWECPLQAWAHRVAYHAAARVWRRPGRRLEEPLPSALSQLGPGSARSAPGPSSRHAGLEVLRVSLSIEDQTLLTLRYDRELEWEEIAAVLEEGGGDEPTPPSPGGDERRRPRARQAATLRKRYERLTRRLREEARHHGLID
jgi:RNA polymerase sigma-70 factor, ECF subfamily